MSACNRSDLQTLGSPPVTGYDAQKSPRALARCVHAAKGAIHHQQAPALSDMIHALCPAPRALWKSSDWAKAEGQTNLGSHIKQLLRTS